MNFDCIIIGGGIIGMSTARELAIRGAKVAIFDRGQLGMESSWAAGGIISPMRPWAESSELVQLSEYSKNIYQEYVKKIESDSGIDTEYIESGLVIINQDHAAKTKLWAGNKNIKFEEKFERKVFGLNLPAHSILLPNIAQVRPPKLLEALRKSLESLSVSVFENTEIKNIEVKNNHFRSVIFDNGKITADSVIVTAGAWSKMILSNIDVEIDTKPIRGQMLCLKPDEFTTNKMILDGSHYFIPRKDGCLLIGSTMEDVGFENQTTKEGRQDLLDWAYSIEPNLNKAKLVSHWSGLRPSGNTGKPLIGRIAEFKNIFVNTAHFRKGILQAPASAQLLVDSMSGKSSFTDIGKFNVDYSIASLEAG